MELDVTPAFPTVIGTNSLEPPNTKYGTGTPYLRSRWVEYSVVIGLTIF